MFILFLCGEARGEKRGTLHRYGIWTQWDKKIYSLKIKNTYKAAKVLHSTGEKISTTCSFSSICDHQNPFMCKVRLIFLFNAKPLPISGRVNSLYSTHSTLKVQWQPVINPDLPVSPSEHPRDERLRLDLSHRTHLAGCCFVCRHVESAR